VVLIFGSARGVALPFSSFWNTSMSRFQSFENRNGWGVAGSLDLWIWRRARRGTPRAWSGGLRAVARWRVCGRRSATLDELDQSALGQRAGLCRHGNPPRAPRTPPKEGIKKAGCPDSPPLEGWSGCGPGWICTSSGHRWRVCALGGFITARKMELESAACSPHNPGGFPRK